VRKQLVRGWKKQYIPADAGVGQASREVLYENLAKDPASRTGMVKYHSAGTGRIGHVIKLGSVGLNFHSSEIPRPEVLDGSGALKALSGWKREGFAFCE